MRFRELSVAIFVGMFCLRPGGAQQERQIALPPQNAVAEVQFTQVSSVRELSDGTVIVADRSEGRLVLVNWRSTEETFVGREGQGPGEYGSIGWIYPLAGDSSLFTDPRQGRWSVLHGASFSRTFGVDLPLTVTLGARLSGTDDMGHVLGMANPEADDGRPRTRGAADTVLLVLGDLISQSTETVARVRGQGEEGFQLLPARGGRPRSFIGGNPLATADQALLFSDGWIGLARADPYRVDWRTPAGQWVQGPALPFDVVKLDADQKRLAIARYFGSGGSFDPGDLRGWPETIPPFQVPLKVPVLLPAPNGDLLIFRTPTDPESPKRYDVVGRDGRLVGFILIPPEETLIGSGHSSVFVLSVDEIGLQTLTRHPWPMGPEPG